jgi:hypothetical protein
MVFALGLLLACKKAEAPAEVVAPPSAVPEPESQTESPSPVAEGDPLLHLLGNGVPEAVEVLAVHEQGEERIVLYRLDVAKQWTAGQPDADELLDPVYEVLDDERCSNYGRPDAECIEATVAERPDEFPNVPPEAAGYYVSDSFAKVAPAPSP